MKVCQLFVLGLLFPFLTFSQNLDSLSLDFAHKSWDTFYELLSLPNDAHFPEDVMENVRWSEATFQSKGFQTQRLATPTLPLVLAEKTIDPRLKTVLIYLQLDGQPVEPSKWQQESPWKPVLKKQNPQGEWEIIPWAELSENYDPDTRIFARASSDAKGPVVMYLSALDALETLGEQPQFNMKVIMDFEEELGSPRLPQAVIDNREKLGADMLVIFDGPRHLSNQPTLSYGARGITSVTLKVFGPRAPQHSGHYGNYVPNPALRMSQLLASMKDETGRVLIPGWYEGISLSPAIKKILNAVPDDETRIRSKIGIATSDQVAPSYQESLQYPSLNIRGLKSAWVGKERRTIIPSEAIAEIDIRLVKESDPEHLIKLLKQHITEQGYHFVSGSPTESERKAHSRLISFEYAVSYQAFRTELDTPVGKWLRSAMQTAFGHPPIEIRTMGGSIPISPFVNTLGIPAVSVPTVNRDNNQHSPNENIRVGNYVEGIKTMIAILRTQP